MNLRSSRVGIIERCTIRYLKLATLVLAVADVETRPDGHTVQIKVRFEELIIFISHFRSFTMPSNDTRSLFTQSHLQNCSLNHICRTVHSITFAELEIQVG